MIVLLAAVLVVRRYADKERTPIACMILAYVGFFLAFSIAVFVPLDIYTTIQMGHYAELLIIWWSIFCYSSFVLNYLIFPIAVSYMDAGEFTPKGKFYAALKA